MNQRKIETAIEELAAKNQLRFFGITSLNVAKDFKRYSNWIDEGRQAGMKYLENNLEVRKDPQALLPNAQSAIIFGLNYNLGDRWQRGAPKTSPRFAMYSRLRDYHKTLRLRLNSLESELKSLFPELADESFRAVVDSAPILERALAAKTKSGFIGKNTCFIDPKYGSFFLLSEILTTYKFNYLETEPASENPPPRTTQGGCGTCKRCQVHCPTGALSTDFQIDARKCLSWWTIENRGPIPKEFWPWIGHYVFGCDICQLVCPWNRNLEPLPSTDSLIKLAPQIDMFEVATMDQSFYERTFGGTPATRAKREGLIRNALIAMHVNKDHRTLSAIEHLKNETNIGITETINSIFDDIGK